MALRVQYKTASGGTARMTTVANSCAEHFQSSAHRSRLSQGDVFEWCSPVGGVPTHVAAGATSIRTPGGDIPIFGNDAYWKGAVPEFVSFDSTAKQNETPLLISTRPDPTVTPVPPDAIAPTDAIGNIIAPVGSGATVDGVSAAPLDRLREKDLIPFLAFVVIAFLISRRF